MAYVFFWHLSNSAFLLLLLALSSGYCITRGTLNWEDLGRVVLIPVVIFVAGFCPTRPSCGLPVVGPWLCAVAGARHRERAGSTREAVARVLHVPHVMPAPQALTAKPEEAAQDWRHAGSDEDEGRPGPSAGRQQPQQQQQQQEAGSR